MDGTSKSRENSDEFSHLPEKLLSKQCIRSRTIVNWVKMLKDLREEFLISRKFQDNPYLLYNFHRDLRYPRARFSEFGRKTMTNFMKVFRFFDQNLNGKWHFFMIFYKIFLGFLPHFRK